NVTDGGFHRLRDIIAAIAHARGREPRLLRVPEAIARSAAFAVEVAFRSLRKTPPVDREIVAKLVEDVAVRGDRIQKELGFRPRFGLEEGWRRALAGESEGGTSAMGADEVGAGALGDVEPGPRGETVSPIVLDSSDAR